MNYLHQINGQCACGNISLRFFTNKDLNDLPFRKCGCPYCKPKDPVHFADNDGEVIIKISDPEAVRKDRHGYKSADFLSCTKCDKYIGAVMDLDGKKWAVLNAKNFAIDQNLLQNAETRDFSEETLEERLKRRKKTWTPVF